VTVLKTVLLVVGMGVLGVPLILGLLSPAAGAIVARTVPEPSWDAAMTFFTQAAAGLCTYLIGAFGLGLPWYAALIAALLVGGTSYARRVPEPTL
jgi:hypothetical protein